MGRSSQGRRTEAERHAIEEQSDSVEQDLREALGIDEFIDGLTGAALRERASFGPTSNIAGIKTGYSGPGMKTVLPAAPPSKMTVASVAEVPQVPEAV